MIESMDIFASSLLLNQHPLNKLAPKWKKQYYLLLEYFMRNHYKDFKFVEERLKHYRINFFRSENELEYTASIKNIIKALLTAPFPIFKEKFEYCLICDVALILLDPESILEIAEDIKATLNIKNQRYFEKFVSNLLKNPEHLTSVPYLSEMIKQYKDNNDFFKQPVETFIVTANMSAGKSTLINALIGKKIARTSQEVCTGNICYIVNKPFDDNRVHLLNSYFTMNADEDKLRSITWDSGTCVSSYFTNLHNSHNRVCIIDTPGVNSAVNKDHGEMTRNTIKTVLFDKLIYVMNAGQLGTNEEINHLVWIHENVPEEKIIFVLNKLDNFNTKQDSITNSIKGVYEDLQKIGYKSPAVYPISAIYALLLKRQFNGDSLDDDDMDQLELLTKKFNREAYDLSKYYSDTTTTDEDEFITMSKKCGLYGLENILLGGTK